jgi:anti-anti-sigma factor
LTDEKENAMSRYNHANHRDHGNAATEISPSSDSRGKLQEIPPEDGTTLCLRVHAIERTAIVRFRDAEILLEEASVQAVSRQLHRLIGEEGHTRLVVNFAGVGYVSSEVLAVLAVLQRAVEPTRGRITLCGLDPLLRDMVRITQLDRVFDMCTDETEALGLVARYRASPPR